ncbi:hypothetical protein [Pseudocnuella soli]|uniref:hypothetical protein n=1 Tax=Pseudocnuella soli TaxID=2502779 RepID=UPI0010537AEF|nr:hypothetical protein [Pseudocnuella soli]
MMYIFRENIDMKPFDFSLLSQHDQMDLIYTTGVYLGKYKFGRVVKVLYQLDYFYIEIAYRKYRSHIESVRCFESTEPLDPYLERINIEELISC